MHIQLTKQTGLRSRRQRKINGVYAATTVKMVPLTCVATENGSVHFCYRKAARNIQKLRETRFSSHPLRKGSGEDEATPPKIVPLTGNMKVS